MKTDFDWTELAFGSKKPLRDLNAIFIAAPREISEKRFVQLVKAYLPKGDIVLGLAKESHILGFEGQPQFKALRHEQVQLVIDKVNASHSRHKIYTLTYYQRELSYCLEKLNFKEALFINGSWKYLFHTRPEFYMVTNRRIPYQLLSPFSDEQEALQYEAQISLPLTQPTSLVSETDMLRLADEAATWSFDNGFQTGVTLGRKSGRKYAFLASSFNKVVPFQTYAMHYGASRERYFSPMHDLNHYDTIHAEVGLIIAAQKSGINLVGTTLFINLLPCPNCARMFAETDIEEFVYREDHSDGYGVKMLTLAGKKVRRVV